MKQKKFYVISLGPGNPELITIQALKALAQSEVIFMPTKSEDLSWDRSVAFKILKNIKNAHAEWFNEAETPFKFMKTWEDKFFPLLSPMKYNPNTWKLQVEAILKAFETHASVGYVTLGDAAVYSTAYYLLDIIEKDHPEIFEVTEIIPGITSYSYASSKVKKPLCLGDSKLEILPTNIETPSTTKVYMRFHRGDSVNIDSYENLYYFENLGLSDETIAKGKPDKIKKYLTLVIDFAREYLNESIKKDQ
mgnify:CR=1 FL=1